MGAEVRTSSHTTMLKPVALRHSPSLGMAVNIETWIFSSLRLPVPHFDCSEWPLAIGACLFHHIRTSSEAGVDELCAQLKAKLPSLSGKVNVCLWYVLWCVCVCVLACVCVCVYVYFVCVHVCECVCHVKTLCVFAVLPCQMVPFLSIRFFAPCCGAPSEMRA